MTSYESHLQHDGTVFPPVTPDPPLPPGMAEIEVPDIVPVSTPDGPGEDDQVAAGEAIGTVDQPAQGNGDEPTD